MRRLRYCYSGLVLLLLTGWYSSVFSQQKQLDSLREIITKNPGKNLNIDAYNDLSRLAFDKESFDSALLFAQIALKQAYKNNYKKGIAKASGNVANVYLMQSDFKKAIEYNLKSLKEYEETGDEKGACSVYSNLGIVYFQLSSYPKALNSFFTALKIDIHHQDSIGIAQDYRDIGMIYSELENFDEALRYYRKALGIQEILNDEENMAITQSNIALIYTDLGKNKEAIDYFQKAITTFEKMDNQYGLSFFYNGIGSAYKNQRDYATAAQYYLKALDLKKLGGDKKGQGELYNSLGNLSLLKGNISEAKRWLDSALIIAEEIKVNSLLATTYQNLSVADSLNSNFKQSLSEYQKFIAFRDSSFNNDNKTKIDHLKMEFEFSQKEDSIKMESQKKIALKEMALASRKKEEWFMLAVISLLFIIGGLLFLQNKLHKKNNIHLAQLNGELDEEVSKNKLLNKEMHHRIKNNLFMMYSLLHIQEDDSGTVETRNSLSAARQRIESIASLHEQLYQKKTGKISLKNYLTKFTNDIEQQFVNHRLIKTHIDIDESIQINSFIGMPLAMLINELLTNSVKHAQTNSEYLEIKIIAKQIDEKEFFIEYYDNGQMDANKIKKSPFNGIGNRIIYLLCRQIKGELDSTYKKKPFHYRIKLSV